MVEVKPEQAATNLAEWFREAGYLSAANWLNKPEVDYLIRVYAVPVFIAVAIILFFWPIICMGFKLVSLRRSKASTSNANRYMNAYEAIHYLADESKWGNQTRQYQTKEDVPGVVGKITMRKMPLLEAPGEFSRRAQQGTIKAFGRLNGVGEHIEIPATYWMSAVLSTLSLNDHAVSETMRAVPVRGIIPTYTDIIIARKDVERAWPQPLTRRIINGYAKSGQ